MAPSLDTGSHEVDKKNEVPGMRDQRGNSLRSSQKLYPAAHRLQLHESWTVMLQRHSCFSLQLFPDVFFKSSGKGK